MRSHRFTLALLGTAHLSGDAAGNRIAIPQKGLVLMARLALQPKGFAERRSAAAQFLWENVDHDKASANLRTLLARMRSEAERTGLQFVESDRECVWLLATAAVDVQRLLSLAEAGTSAAARELCDLYQGDLLESVESGGPELSDWLAARRAELRNVFISAAAGFLEVAVLPDDEQAIGHVARRLLRLDPCQEAAYRAMMRAHAAAGRLRELENLYRTCCTRLSQDLDVVPDPKTVQLYRELCGFGRGDTVPLPMYPQQAIALPSPNPGNHPAPPRGLPTVCVLMPAEAGDNEKYDLAAALLEDVTIGLCRQRTFTVLAPYTAWRLGPDGPDGDFVERYGIDYVVQSRVQTYGGDTFLATKLIDARSRRISWADRYLFNRAELGAQYQQLATRIVTSLNESVEAAELGRRDSSAYYSYLLGSRALSEVKLPNVRRARTLFRASMRQDGRFGPAVSGVARTFHMEWLLLARGEFDLLNDAEMFSRRALSVDPDGAHGLRELGLCSLYRGRFDESLASFAEAERRHPQFADLLADYADALSMSGMPGDALAKIEQATGLNPLGPDRYWWYQGTIYYQLEQYEAAIRSVQRMRDSTPAYKLLAACWAMLGDLARAKEYVHKVKDVYPDFTVNKWLSMIPIRDAIARRGYEEGLRLAGFS